MIEFIKGRGTNINLPNKFSKEQRVQHFEDISSSTLQENTKTEYIPVKSKSIVNKVASEDIPFMHSINPYEGCEHGCIYCYARNSHHYWGFNSGLDFEQKIMVKHDAPVLLEKCLRKTTWQAQPITLSGNTDCYQPAEKKFEITRKLLEVFWKYKHPVSIITKNKLILRDLDILKKMARHDLVKVTITINSLQESLRSVLEPRTSTAAGRLEAIRQLSFHGIPTSVMISPIIPALNDHEIFSIVREAADRGAKKAHYIVVRLNGDLGFLFSEWLAQHFPDRKEKVLQLIKSCHDDQLNDSRSSIRMTGTGAYAENIQRQFHLASKRYLEGRKLPPFNLDMHSDYKSPQLKLF